MSTLAFGKRLKDRRVQMGIDQHILASALGISRTMIGKIERGERETLPSRDQIAIIAKILDTTIEALIEGNEFFFDRFTEDEQRLLRDVKTTARIKELLAQIAEEEKKEQASANEAAKIQRYYGKI